MRHDTAKFRIADHRMKPEIHGRPEKFRVPAHLDKRAYRPAHAGVAASGDPIVRDSKGASRAFGVCLEILDSVGRYQTHSYAISVRDNTGIAVIRRRDTWRGHRDHPDGVINVFDGVLRRLAQGGGRGSEQS